MKKVYFLLLMCSVLNVKCASDGILYPQESETRELRTLDGLWKFSKSHEMDPATAFRDLLHLENCILMAVPSSYNDVTADADLRDHVGWVWYQREFYTPQRWQQSNQRVFVRFGSVHYFAVVWINGVEVTQHIGGHLPFQAEITQFLQFGTANTITVAVNNTLTLHTIPQGQVLHPNDTDMYPPGYVINSYNFDFFNYAGIHRTIHLFTVPETHINDVTVWTDTEGETGIVTYNITYNVSENAVPNTAHCLVTLYDNTSMAVVSREGCEGELHVLNAELWWPVYMSHTPGYQYTLQMQLLNDDGTVEDVYRLAIGIRVLKWDDGLHINGKPVYLRGLGRHEDSDIRGKGFDYPLLVRDYNLLKWLAANSYRTSHYPYSEEAMDLADTLGIMVIAESPAVNLDNFDAQLLQLHKNVMSEMIQRDKNRACIIMWSLANEPRSQRKKAEPHFKEMVEHVKALDMRRPVTFVTNQEYINDRAAQYMDIIGVNRYNAWYSDAGLLELIPRQVEAEFSHWHSHFNKSLFMSEYGADAISGMHMLPTFTWTEDYQAELIKQHFLAFDKLRKEGFFIGEMIWNFADFATQQGYRRVVGNHKGIFTRERQPKSSAYVLRERYHSLAHNVDNYQWQ